VSSRSRRARAADIGDLARAMPFTREDQGSDGRSVFQVGGRSFVFFRNPRPDAVDADGNRLTDVVVIWVASEADKQSLVQDETSPFFTTPHFDGHPSVLLRLADVGRLSLAELTEVVQDAWLSRASAKRARDWLASRNLG
jgi:hypothetical protein